MRLRTVFFGGILPVGILWAAVAAAEIGAAHSRSRHAPVAAEEAERQLHKPRHGGYFGDADDLYHYEVLLQTGGRLILYVNDDYNRPLDVRALDGRWTLEPDSSSPLSGVFTPAEDGAYFVATLLPLQADPVHVKVAVSKDGVWAGMEFFLPASPPQ